MRLDIESHRRDHRCVLADSWQKALAEIRADRDAPAFSRAHLVSLPTQCVSDAAIVRHCADSAHIHFYEKKQWVRSGGARSRERTSLRTSFPVMQGNNREWLSHGQRKPPLSTQKTPYFQSLTDYPERMAPK